MTDAGSGPQEGMAQALSDLTDQTTQLVRQEVDLAKREMLDKLKGLAPAGGLLAVSALSGLFAAASLYRLAIRVVDRVSPGGSGSVVAPALFATVSLLCGARGLARIRQSAPPIPSETLHATGAAMRQAGGDL